MRIIRFGTQSIVLDHVFSVYMDYHGPKVTVTSIMGSKYNIYPDHGKCGYIFRTMELRRSWELDICKKMVDIISNAMLETEFESVIDMTNELYKEDQD